MISDQYTMPLPVKKLLNAIRSLLISGKELCLQPFLAWTDLFSLV
jgi:hypothetical protein